MCKVENGNMNEIISVGINGFNSHLEIFIFHIVDISVCSCTIILFTHMFQKYSCLHLPLPIILFLFFFDFSFFVVFLFSPHYFKNIKISALALLKMVTFPHCFKCQNYLPGCNMHFLHSGDACKIWR